MGGEGFAAVAAFVLMVIVAGACIEAGMNDDKVAHPTELISIGVAIIAIGALFIICSVIVAYIDRHDN